MPSPSLSRAALPGMGSGAGLRDLCAGFLVRLVRLVLGVLLQCSDLRRMLVPTGCQGPGRTCTDRVRALALLGVLGPARPAPATTGCPR